MTNIWIMCNNNLKIKNPIIKGLIKINNKNYKKIDREFVLTKSKLFSLKNNMPIKYIKLNTTNVIFNNQTIIFNNSKNFFKLFFDDCLTFIKWKKLLTQISILLDFNKEYKILNLIGKGRSSNIFKAWKIKNNKIFAVKHLRKNENPIKEIFNEIKIMRKLKNHPNIIELKEVYENKNSFFLVLEYANHYNLKYLLDNKIIINENKIAKHILKGIQFIHSKKIIHRDIKPENIFLIKQDNGEIIPKIGDFGISFKSKNDPIIKNIGTLGYIAPELFYYKSSQIFNFKYEIDIYSFGCLMYYLFFKKLIFNFNDLRELKNKNKNNLFDFVNEFFSQNIEFKKLILNCWEIDPKKRIKLEHITSYFN